MKEFYIDGYDVVEQFPDDTPNSVIQDTLNKAYPETDDQFYARIQAPSTLASSVSFEDFKRFKESKPDYTPSDYASMVAHGAGIAAKELTEAVKETISAASRGELGEIGLSLAEGAARGTYDLEMLGKRVSDNLNTIIEPYFQETGDAEQDQYNRFLAVKEMDNLRHAARQGDTTLLKRFGIEVDPSKINQGIAEGSSYLLDPTLLVGMPGASKVASILSKGAAKPFIKAGQVAGKSADLITDAETWVSRVAKQGMTKLDESTGGLGKYIVPGGVGATAAAAGLGPAAGTALAVAGAVPALRVAEGLLTGFGKSMLGYPTRNTALRSMALTQPGTIAGKMAGSLKFLDTPVEYAGRAAAGLVAGAGIGGGLGFAAGGLEGAAQGIGTGGVLGASVGGLSRFAEGMTGVNLRRAEDNDFRNWRSNQDDSTKAFLDTLVNRKDKIQVMDAIQLGQATVGDQASIRILDSKEFQKRFPGGKGVQVVEGDLPVAYIDSQKGDAETLFHEVFHAIARLDGFDAVTTKIGQDITDLYSIKEIHELMKDYESSGVKLLGETTAERFKSVTEELAADYFANLIKGKDSSYLFKGSTFGQSIRNTLSKVVAGKLDRMADTFTGTSFSNVQKKSKGIDRAINDLVKARREAHRDVTLSSGEPIKIYGENDLGNDKTFNALEAMGIAETDGKGRRVFRSQYRINKDSRAVTSELDKVLKGADSTDGLQLKDDGTWEGKRMSPSQVEAILRSGSIPDKVKEVVRYIQGTAGDVHNITYGAATYKTRSGKTRYRNLPISNRDGIIYGIEVSPKTGTMIARTLDLSLVNSKIKRLWGSDPRFAREFGTADKMYSDALRYIKALGGDIPTAQVLGSASKRNLLNRLLGIRNVKGNPEIVEGATIKEGDHPWRSFRLDRVVKMRHLKDVDSTFSKSAYEQGQRNFSPGQKTTLTESDLVRFSPAPDNPNANLSDLNGRAIQVLTTDFSGSKDKTANGVAVQFRGGPGHLSLYDGWGFTNINSAKAFITRLKRDGFPLVGITSMNPNNHLNSKLARRYYGLKWQEMVETGKVKEKEASRHIKEALGRILKGQSKKSPLTKDQMKSISEVKSVKDFARVFENIPWKAAPVIYTKLGGKTLPIKQNRLKELGMDLQSIADELRDPSYEGVGPGNLLAVAEYSGKPPEHRPELNENYPYFVELKEKAFLKEFTEVTDLTSRTDVKTKSGKPNSAVLMGAGVMLDRLSSGEARFSPSRTLNNRGGAIYTTEQGHKAIQTSSRAGVRVYGSSGKRIGPVFASVERAERYLSK